jgi:hypothetical protein
MWTVPALVFLAVGTVETPQMIENARIYEQQQLPVIEVQEIQASSDFEEAFPTLAVTE